MESTSYCLSVPPLSSCTLKDFSAQGHHSLNRQILFVSENEIIYPAGNALQITKLPIPSNDSKRSKDEIFSELTRHSRNTDGSLFVKADLGRGFSSLCYNRYRMRVAYSPRSTNPCILVKALKDQKLLCKIKEGAKLEYADICFNQTGSKLAAIGKGEIDAILFVWSIEERKLLEDDQDMKHFPFKAVLMARYELKYAVSQCLFNPSDDSYISLLHSDRKSVTICQLSKFIDQFKVTERCYRLPKDMETDDHLPKISAVAWEAQNQLLVGTSCGSIHVIIETSRKMKTIQRQDNVKEYGAVRSIIISATSRIVGFEEGKLVFVKRHKKSEPLLTITVDKKVSMQKKISGVLSDPSFTSILLFTPSGELYTYLFDKSKNDYAKQIIRDNETNKETDSKGIAITFPSIISSLAPLVITGKASVSLLLCGGCDGKVKVLKDSHMKKKESYVLQSTIASLDIKSPVTCLETLQGYPVFAVGSADGCLRFVYVGRRKDSGNVGINGVLPIDMIVLKSEFLSFTPITSLAFATKTKKLVASCYESGQAFVLCAEPNNLHVLGMVKTMGGNPLCATSWCTQNSSHLLIGSQDGNISCFDTSSMSFSPDPLEPLWECSFDTTLFIKAIVITGHIGGKIAYVAHTGVKGFDTYNITTCSNVFKTEKKQSYYCFSKHCCCLVNTNGLLLAGSVSGEIAIFECGKGSKLTQIFAKKNHTGPILAMSLSSDKSQIYSTSLDGTLYNYSIGDPQYIPQSAYEYDYLIPKNPNRKIPTINNLDTHVRDGSGRRMTWLCKAKDRLKGEHELKSVDTKQIIRNKIDSLRTCLQKRLEDNESTNNIEKLETVEFLIDLHGDKHQRETITSRVNSYLAKIKSEKSHYQDEANKIKQQHLKAMEFKFHRICSISDSPPLMSIINFPLHSLNHQEERIIKIVRTLRCNEISEMQRNINQARKNGKSWSMCISNLSPEDPCYIFDPSMNCKEHNTSLDSENDNDNDGDFFDIGQANYCKADQMLYPSLAVKTKCQRITQMLLLRLVRRDMITSFNKTFMNIKTEKENVISQINSASDKIDEILQKNCRGSAFQRPSTSHDINPEMFYVEVPNMLKESPCRTINIELISSASKRALADMMDGSLNDRTLRNIDSTKKPEWMPVLETTDMTEDQMKESKEFDDKEKEMDMMKQEHSQKLSKKVKNLESEIRNLTKSFNQEISELQNQRQIVQDKLDFNELYQTTLANCIFQSEDIIYTLKILQNMKALEQQKLNVSTTTDLERVKTEYERVKYDLMQKLHQNKSFDKNFRKQIQQACDGAVDQETVNLLHQMFRKRHSQRNEVTNKIHSMKKNEAGGAIGSITRRSKIGRQSGRESSIDSSKNPRSSSKIIDQGSSNSIVDNIQLAIKEAKEDQHGNQEFFLAENEPFYSEDDTSKHETFTKYVEISVGHIPEGFIISEKIWSTMQELRREKIEKEIEAEKTSSLVQETKSLLETFENKQTEVINFIEDLNVQIKEINKSKKSQSSDLLLVIQQGQDEIKVNPLSTDYHNSIFISSTQIENINQKIQDFGNSRTHVLAKTKKLLKIINEMQWKNELLRLKENNEKELYIDCQLMHLSNELQAMLRGEDFSVKESQVEDQLSRQSLAYDAKIKKLRSEHSALAKTILERTKENCQLEKQLDSLRDSVIKKEQTFEGMMYPQKNCKLSMTKIMQRSKLLELVRNQSNQISNLRSEVDKLRQKTFPSFPASS